MLKLATVLHWPLFLFVEIDKQWDDVIGLASDSTNYMIKLYNDLKPHNPKLLHFNDVCHLIHVAIDFALQCEEFSILRKVIIKFGAIFKHANKLEQHFKEICRSNGLPETELSKPSAVVKIRWYSFFESAQGTLKLWRYLLIFIDHPDSVGEKVTGNNENTQSLGQAYCCDRAIKTNTINSEDIGI